MKSSKITYLIAIFATLIPCWVGDALLNLIESEEDLFSSSSGFLVLFLFGFAFWGTSFAYFYLRKFKYGLLAGFGKWLLIFIGIWTNLSLFESGEGGHPYLIFIGIALAMIWGLIDFGLLHPTLKKINLAEKSDA